MKQVAVRPLGSRKCRLFETLGSIALLLTTGAWGQSLDPTNFIVVGGGLSAGFADFQLIARHQEKSYPKLMAGQMGTIMPQPVFRPSPPPPMVSFAALPSTVAPTNQSVLRGLPFPLFAFNLSVPFFKVADSFALAPENPLVREGDLRQTFANLILGYPLLILEDPPSWTQVVYAELMAPTLLFVQMGFGDVLDAALNNDPARITPSSSFSADYAALVNRLQAIYPTTLLMTVPNPTQTAYFVPLEQAAEHLGIPASELADRFGLGPADWLTIGGLVEAGQLLERGGDQLSTDSVLSAATAAAIAAAVDSYNATVTNLASERDRLLFDLKGFLEEVEMSGLTVGPHHLGGEYLEGFYSRDGLFPGVTGHAVLANRLLTLLNSRFSVNYPLVDEEEIAAEDELLMPETFGASPNSGKRKPWRQETRSLKP